MVAWTKHPGASGAASEDRPIGRDGDEEQRDGPRTADIAGDHRTMAPALCRETPPDMELHLIVDNYSTHKHAKVETWLKRHPRFHMHFIPTSSSWLNWVERWFRELTDKRIRRSAFKSVPQLIGAIMDYIGAHHEDPKSFVWTAQVHDILAKVRRARSVLHKTASV
jgi:transposase